MRAPDIEYRRQNQKDKDQKSGTKIKREKRKLQQGKNISSFMLLLMKNAANVFALKLHSIPYANIITNHMFQPGN